MSDLTDLKITHEIQRIDAERDLARLRATELENKIDDWHRFRASDDADGLRNGVLLMNQTVSDDSVGSAVQDLDHLSRRCLANGEGALPIRIVLCSPGGAFYHGMMLFDFIGELRRRGHRVTTVAYGFAASMASIILQAGDERVMGENSYLMLHEPSQFTGGKAGEAMDDALHLKRINEHGLRIFAARSKLSERQLKAKYERKDWWVPADECLELGLIDSIESAPPFVP